MTTDYIYLGDRLTDPVLKKQPCRAVQNQGKCIRGQNGSMFVEFMDGTQHVVLARLLRKQNK